MPRPRAPHSTLWKQKAGAGRGVGGVPRRLPHVPMPRPGCPWEALSSGSFGVFSRLRCGSHGFYPAQSVVQWQALRHLPLPPDGASARLPSSPGGLPRPCPRSHSPRSCCPVLDSVASCLPSLFWDQNVGIGAALSVQMSQPKWLKDLEGEANQPKRKS